MHIVPVVSPPFKVSNQAFGRSCLFQVLSLRVMRSAPKAEVAAVPSRGFPGSALWRSEKPQSGEPRARPGSQAPAAPSELRDAPRNVCRGVKLSEQPPLILGGSFSSKIGGKG